MKTKARLNIRRSEDLKTSKSFPVFFRISFGAADFGDQKKYVVANYFTGLQTIARHWKVREGRSKTDSYLNGVLERANVRIHAIWSEMHYNGNPNVDDFKQALANDKELAEILNRKTVVNGHYMPPFEFIENYIDKAVVSAGTKKDYRNSLQHLKDFDEYRGKSLSWKSADYQYYLELVDYLKEKRLKASTIDKIIKNLKVFLSQADLMDGIEVCQDFKKTVSGRSLFAKVDKEETDHVYLTESEIQQITNADMPDERLGEIRDLFIVQCWTGLRISDLSRLERGNIKNGLLTIKTKKTKESVVIPVTEELQEVLNKYPERLPEPPSSQHFNRQLKIICKLAGIDEPTMAETKRNGMTVIAPVPKYELVTSHTGRRSFATNLYRRGIPSSQLMFLTGHKTEAAFMKYIKVSKVDNAKDVQKKLKVL
jgi:integrase